MKKRTIISLIALTTAVPTLASYANDNAFPDFGTPEWNEMFAVDVVNEPLDQSPLPRPADGMKYSVTFKGNIAGFDVGRVFIDANISNDAYALDYKMEQKGIARWFSDAEAESYGIGTFGTDGLINGHYYYNHDYEAEDDQKRVELLRMPNERRLRLWRLPEYDFREPVPEDMALGAYDPMGALITLGFPEVEAGKEPCDRRAHVLEGRLRYDLTLSPAGTKKLRNRGKGRFNGFTYRCKLGFERIAGYREKDRQKEVEGDLYVYLAPLPEEYRTKQLAYIPVHVTAKQAILTASLEAKNPTLTFPDGRKVLVGAKR